MKNPLVVGYKGEIGSFILQGLLKTMPKAGNIWCYDVNESLEEKRERIKKADVIFLCIPMELTNAWFDLFHKEIKGKTVIEQTSLKYPLYQWRNFKFFTKNVNLLSMHILFRPSSTPNFEDRSVALIGRGKWVESLHDEFNGRETIEILTGARAFYYNNYIDHDKDMALQQALVHKVLLSLDKVINKDINSTFLVKRIKEMARRIERGDPKLYKMIQGSKYKEKAIEKFIKKLKT